MERGTIKTSVIYVGTKKGTRVYANPDEVPPRMRKRLKQSVSGPNSATLYIADQRGQEELLQTIAQRRKRRPVVAAPPVETVEPVIVAPPPRLWSARLLAVCLALILIALLTALLLR